MTEKSSRRRPKILAVLKRGITFYTPIQNRSYYVVPSVCLSVYFLSPLHNSDTVQDIFMKLGTNINHHQTITRIDTPSVCGMELWPFEIFALKIVSALLLQYCPEYFHETLYKYKPLSDNVQRKRTITPLTFFTELCPFENFHMKIVSAL